MFRFGFVSQTLPFRQSLLSISPQLRRFRSTFSGDDCLIELDLSPSPSSPASEITSDSDALTIKKLDDVVQRLIIQKATPYWLPFLPGSSFWVPPRPGGGGPIKFADFVGKISDNLPHHEPISFSASDFRWPSSRYYLAQRSESEDDEALLEIENGTEEEALSDSPDTHLSEDKEG